MLNDDDTDLETLRCWDDLDGSMIVTMISVRMVKSALDEIVHMIPMGNRFMTTSGTMVMTLVVTAGCLCHTVLRIGGGYLDFMLIIVIAVGVMQMPVVQVVGVPLMVDGGVAAIGAMVVIMGLVGLAGTHRIILYSLYNKRTGKSPFYRITNYFSCPGRRCPSFSQL